MATKKPSGLGRGLGALLGDDVLKPESAGSLSLPISQVESCSSQPRKLFDEVCASAGFVPRIVMECDYTMRAYMVMQRIGMTIATAHTKKLGYCGEAAAIPIIPFTPRAQNVYWNPDRYQGLAAQAFLSYICEYFKDMSF